SRASKASCFFHHSPNAMDCCALLHDFINTITYSAPTGLAGGERSELPGRRGTTIRTPAGVAGSPRTPAAAGANSCCTIPGVRFRSPPAKALAKGPSGNKVYILLLACGPQPAGARRRRARIGFVAASRRCPTSPSSRRLASARPALAPKCEFISARALSSRFTNTVTNREVCFYKTSKVLVFRSEDF